MKKNIKILSMILTLATISALIVSCTAKVSETEMFLTPHAVGTEAPAAPETEPSVVTHMLSEQGESAKQALTEKNYYLSDLFSEEAEYLLHFPKESDGFFAVSPDMRTSLAYIEVQSEEDLEELVDSIFESLDVEDREDAVEQGGYLVYSIEEDGTMTRIYVYAERLSILFLCEGSHLEADCLSVFGFEQ